MKREKKRISERKNYIIETKKLLNNQQTEIQKAQRQEKKKKRKNRIKDKRIINDIENPLVLRITNIKISKTIKLSKMENISETNGQN